MSAPRKVEKCHLPSKRQADVLQVFGQFARGEAGEHTIPTLPDVARALGVRTATVLGMVQMLRAKRYVRRNGDRSRIWELTEQGIAWCAEHRPKKVEGPTPPGKLIQDGAAFSVEGPY